VARQRERFTRTQQSGRLTAFSLPTGGVVVGNEVLDATMPIKLLARRAREMAG
jgi:SAM-dependent MidA family methyltransferase